MFGVLKKNYKCSLIILIFSLFFMSQAVAANSDNAIYLEKESPKVQSSFLRYFADYYLNDSEKNNSSILYIFSQEGYKPKNSKIINSLKTGISFGGDYQLSVFENGGKTSSKYSIPLAEPYFLMKLNDNKDLFSFRYNFGRGVPENYNKFTSRITQLSYSHKFNDNQTVSFGQDSRVPVGINGSVSTFNLDTVRRTQIARTYSNTYAVGIRNFGEYKYLDYDIGVYDSSRFLHNFFNGAEFIGRVTFKPFSNIDNEKYGTLKLGSSVDYGHNGFDYKVFGTHLGYDIGKFHTIFEYAYADGYNSIKPVDKKSEGFYATVSYDVTKKVRLIAGYDYINLDKNSPRLSNKEYTIGVVYSPKERFKILLNYVYADNKNGRNSDNILLSTRILI